GTGKEQSMTITGGSSLSKDDIERMIREGEEHAAEDKARREAAETRNTAEQLAYSTDKLIKDNEDKLPDDVKTSVQEDVDALKTALAGDDEAAVKTAFDKLGESQQKLGEAIYSSSETAATDGESGEESASDSNDEDIIDAEVVEDDVVEGEAVEDEKKPKK
ncbi:MAG: Hsp70 family protein, partial [Spirochaetaceae bacterium]|nr:Hsp70 family protein [Spirochaetaceae bacterium]